MSNLKPVKFLKHDTCYTYVLKRTGRDSINNMLTESNTFAASYKKEVIEDYSLLKVGDILLMEETDKDRYSYRANRIIDAEGRVYQTQVFTDLHFMVYEGCINGIHTISDAIWFNDNTFDVLSIRLRDLNEIKKSWVKLVIENG